MKFTFFPLSKVTGLSQRLKNSCFLEVTRFNSREPSGELDRIDSRSQGKNRSRTMLNSVAGLNVGETTDNLHTSRGLVKDNTFAKHT